MKDCPCIHRKTCELTDCVAENRLLNAVDINVRSLSNTIDDDLWNAAMEKAMAVLNESNLRRARILMALWGIDHHYYQKTSDVTAGGRSDSRTGS